MNKPEILKRIEIELSAAEDKLKRDDLDDEFRRELIDHVRWARASILKIEWELEHIDWGA